MLALLLSVTRLPTVGSLSVSRVPPFFSGGALPTKDREEVVQFSCVDHRFGGSSFAPSVFQSLREIDDCTFLVHYIVSYACLAAALLLALRAR